VQQRKIEKVMTDQDGSNDNITAHYSGGIRFEPRPGRRMFWLIFFVDLLAWFRQILPRDIKLVHECYRPSVLQFTVPSSNYDSWTYEYNVNYEKKNNDKW